MMSNSPTLHQVLLKFYREKKVDLDYLSTLPNELVDELYNKYYIVRSTQSVIRLSNIGIQTVEGIIVQRYFKAEELLKRAALMLEDTGNGLLYTEIRFFLEN